MRRKAKESVEQNNPFVGRKSEEGCSLKLKENFKKEEVAICSACC